MLLKEILDQKREGKELSAEQINHFVQAVTSGAASDAHIAAFTMAVCCRGMSSDECAALTTAMANSGERCDWRKLKNNQYILDKHSSGGVGDKVSLILAPLLAACGATVPMISGRGLGHTGGTLDKMDSIPGYQSQISLRRLQAAIAECRVAIVGQSRDLAPADRRMYAVRDVTGSVTSTALITASILSKKLAAGLQYLIMDVKCGNGAFCQDMDAAEKLAQSIVQTANKAGLKSKAVITDMNQILGYSAGNNLEVKEAIEFLQNPESAEPRLRSVCLKLGCEALVLAGLCRDETEAQQKMQQALASQQAARYFADMVSTLSNKNIDGNDLLKRSHHYLPTAPVVSQLRASTSGYLAHTDTKALGLAIIELGGGRNDPEDTIDPRVGLQVHKKIGSYLELGEPIFTIHARDHSNLETIKKSLSAAISITNKQPPETPSPILKTIVA